MKQQFSFQTAPFNVGGERQGSGRTASGTLAAPRTCFPLNLPFDPATAQPITSKRIGCPSPAFGVANPEAVIRKAAARAIEMLENTIAELVHARSAVCAGQPPAWPTLGDVTARWLKFCLSVPIDDVRAWTAGPFQNLSVAEVTRRLTRVRNLLASNELRYTCAPSHLASCQTGDWAFVLLCKFGPPTIIHLCQCFWSPGDKFGGNPGEKVDTATHAEFQAQTLIHEASHLTHCTEDFDRARTIGGPECLAQFVAATNNSPIDPCFMHFCPCEGAPGRPSADELQRIKKFCDQNECSLSAFARREPSPGSLRGGAAMGEMKEPSLNLDEASQFTYAVSEIKRQLRRNFRADDERGYLDRRQKLRNAFNAVPNSFAPFLYEQLTDPSDEVAKLFHYRLATATRNEMLRILLDKTTIPI
jgi:hypothetical protein